MKSELCMHPDLSWWADRFQFAISRHLHLSVVVIPCANLVKPMFFLGDAN